MNRIYKTQFGFTIDLYAIDSITNMVDPLSHLITYCVNGCHLIFDYEYDYDFEISDTEAQKRLDEFIERWTEYKNQL